MAEVVKRCAVRAGPERDFPHRWRLSPAATLSRRGVDIHKVQRLLGHARIVTTARNLHLGDADLADAVDAAFPATA